VLATIATVGLAAGDSGLAQMSAYSLDRLTIELAETVNTIPRANGRSTAECAKLIDALERHGDLRMDRAVNELPHELAGRWRL